MENSLIKSQEEIEFDEEFSKEIMQKIQEALDENIWYTQEEVMESLEKLEKENKKCTKSFLLNEQK